MKKGPSQAIDEALFKSIDQLKSTPQYSQVANQLDGIPEEYGKYVNQGLTYLISFAPLGLLGILILYFWISHNSISNKKEILADLIEATNLSQKVGAYEKTILSSKAIDDLKPMKDLINSIASRQGIAASNVRVESFKSEFAGEVAKSISTLTLKNLDSPSLFAFMSDLVVSAKFNISNINLSSDSKKISGQLTLVHFGRRE